MFNLTKKEYKLKNKNDTYNYVRHFNQYEWVQIGFQCSNSKNYYSIQFISESNKNSKNNNKCYNFIYFNTSSYYKRDFTYSQIELYELID